MESDVTQSAAFYKAWAWAETRKKQLLLGFAALLVVGCVVGFIMWRQHESEVAASQNLSRIVAQNALTGEPASAEALAKLATEHAGTSAGERALLLSGARYFTEGRYAEAQTQFQKFLADHAGSELAGQAALGVAASQEAQGKIDEAIRGYKDITERRANDSVMPQAKLSLARLYETQGNFSLARDTYQQLARSDFGNLGREAAMHLQSLLMQHPELTQPETPASGSTNAPVIQVK